MEKKFEKNTFGKRMNSMLRVDSRRMFLTPLFYIMLGIAIVVPILIIVMTTLMEGSPVVDSQTQLPVLDAEGNPVLMEGFKNVWQMIGTVHSSTVSTSGSADASASAAGGMDLVSMCNINLLYFGVAVLICLFVSSDFRSGYSKNLFTVRAKKSDYIMSKTIVGFTASAMLLIAFFAGTVLAGAVMGVPFTMDGYSAVNLVMCMFSKIFLMAAFVAIYVMSCVIAKQKTWLCTVISFGVAMLLFSMIPMVTPLDASLLNVLLTLVGGGFASLGFGAISRLVLKKGDIL